MLSWAKEVAKIQNFRVVVSCVFPQPRSIFSVSWVSLVPFKCFKLIMAMRSENSTFDPLIKRQDFCWQNVENVPEMTKNRVFLHFQARVSRFGGEIWPPPFVRWLLLTKSTFSEILGCVHPKGTKVDFFKRLYVSTKRAHRCQNLKKVCPKWYLTAVMMVSHHLQKKWGGATKKQSRGRIKKSFHLIRSIIGIHFSSVMKSEFFKKQQ